MRVYLAGLALGLSVFGAGVSQAQSAAGTSTAPAVDRTITEILPQVVTWRRDFHPFPELGLQETRTSRIIAGHLRSPGTATGRIVEAPMTGTAEDFSCFQQEVPGLFFFLGVTPPGREATAAQNHSPLFFADESALPVGVRALTNLTLDFLNRR